MVTKWLIRAGVIALALSGSAFAADLPVKASRASLLQYPSYAGAGCYWGVGVEAGVAQTKVDGTFAGGLAAGNLNAAGGSVGATVGCMKGNGTTWVAVEGSVNYQNITATDAANITVASRWSAEQVVKLGGFQDSLLAWLPDFGLNFPALPPIPVFPGLNTVPNTSHPYIMAGMREFGLTASLAATSNREWAAAPMVGAGVLNQLLDRTGKISGAVLDVGAKVAFTSHGFTIGNGGFSGAVKTGNQYFVYGKILF